MRLLAPSLTAAALAAPVFAQPQSIVANGGFEQPAVSAPWVQRAPGETFGGWTVDNLHQGIVQVASFGRPSAVEGAQCLELNFYQSCGVSQTLATQAGHRYILSFQMAGQNDVGPNVKHMQVDWNGATIDTATWDRSASGGAWQRHQYTVAASAATTVLRFYGLEEVDGGPYLDDVRVVPVCGHADLGSAGGVQTPDGQLDNNDFIAFITYFFASDSEADLGVGGGLSGSDGTFDNNDFIAFINDFFSGCD
jgi:hypothetical protein